jgi:hypothetical protein
VNQQLHRLALELLVVPFYDLFFVHGFSLFTLSFRVRKIRGGSNQTTVDESIKEYLRQRIDFLRLAHQVTLETKNPG